MPLTIDIHTEILPESYHWRPEKPVTGTTRFYVRVAEEMVALGHTVNVVYDGRSKLHNGVTYWNRADQVWVDSTENGRYCDVQLDCNIQTRPRDNSYNGPASAENRFQWTSFYNRPDTCVGEGYDRLFLVSDFVHSTLKPYVKCPVTVLELGCDMPTVETPNLAQRPKRCAYTCSPDRGGNFLRQIWPEVQRQTGYELALTPYGQEFSDDDVQRLLDSSRFWVFPAIGTDSIISALEAQARGCIPFVVPHMGLPETLRYGIKTDLFRFQDALIHTLSGAETVKTRSPWSNNQWLDLFEGWEKYRSEALATRPIPTWRDVAEGILKCS
jgi:hypothetical protein